MRAFEIISSLRRAEVNIPVMMLKGLYYRMRGKRIWAHQGTIIKGLGNIETDGTLNVGTDYVGFLHGGDRTLLNINGRLVIRGNVRIHKGCRFDIMSGADCVLDNCFFNGMTNLIIRHGISIGRGTHVAWGCQFLDDDWHDTVMDGGVSKADQRIVIGERVWIGNHVQVMKGVRIADGVIVAAGSVVIKPFEEPNVLIAGNPARVVMRDVGWK